MYILIPDVLDAGQLARLKDFFDKEEMADGRETAGAAGVEIKNNLQVSQTSPNYGKMRQIVMDAVGANAKFNLAAMPKYIRPIRFARYFPGMYYGKHIDNAVMGRQPMTRIDMAFTLFLAPPDTYEGGELVVEEPGTQRKFKLPAGAMVLYNGNSLHSVAPVTAGKRDVAVGWMQCLIRDPQQRRVVFELEELRMSILNTQGRTPEFDTISRNVADLWRMWVEV